jgi:SRSO17 transposase
MIDIILKFHKSTIYFFRYSRKYVNKAVYRHILCMVLAIILIRERRTYANVERLFLNGPDSTCISKCFSNAVFPGFAIQQDLYNHLVKDTLKIPNDKKGIKRTVYIIIDSTAQKKRSKKMENTIIYKKGRTSDHLFVMGILYFPDTNVRIPLPRRLYRTKRYCKEHKCKYRSQVQLAEMMIRHANLPDDMKVTVIFDSYFPSEKVINTIRNQGYHFVCSVKDNRVSNSGEQLRLICQERIASGLLKNRIQIRVMSKRSQYTHKSAQKYEIKVYITHTEKLSISKMGDVQIVFSHKEGVQPEQKNLRYIVTDMLNIDTTEILTIYSYRWQIELYFKELKSHLGLGNYQMLPFRAIVRHVDCVIMAFMYLEHERIGKLQKEPKNIYMLYARTLQMSYVVQHEVRKTNIDYMKRALSHGNEFNKLEQQLMKKLPLVA